MLRPTVSRSVFVGIKHARIWGLRPDLYYCQTVSGFSMWGALSDERTCLSFAKGYRDRFYGVNQKDPETLEEFLRS
jgi:hypothetical protein